MVTYRQVGNFLVQRVDQELASASQTPRAVLPDRLRRRAGGSSNGVAARNVRGVPRRDRRDSSGSTATLRRPGAPELARRRAAAAPTSRSHNPHYRVATAPDVTSRTVDGPTSTARSIVAIPLRDVDDTLHHLLLVEILVATRRAARARAPRVVGRQARAAAARADGARPRARSRPATSPGASSSPTSTPKSAGSASRSTTMMRPDRSRVRGAHRVGGAAAAVRRRRVARAAHAAHVDPRLRRAVPARRGRPARRPRQDDAPHRGRSGRMGVLVDDLLLLARLDQGRPLEREQVDLTRLARRRRRRPARRRARSADRLTRRTARSIVTGDENRLRQVLANLLENAARTRRRRRRSHVRVGESTATTR